MSRLADNLNAEIVLGRVRNRDGRCNGLVKHICEYVTFCSAFLNIIWDMATFSFCY